jgi:hypothetical protein
VVSFTPLPLYPWGKSSQYPLDRLYFSVVTKKLWLVSRKLLYTKWVPERRPTEEPSSHHPQLVTLPPPACITILFTIITQEPLIATWVLDSVIYARQGWMEIQQ